MTTSLPPRIRDCVVRRILCLLDPASSRKSRRVCAQWRRCFDWQWPGGERVERQHDATLVDVSQYAGVHTLSLFYCPFFIDVSSLRSVRTLKLEGCHGVTDVSSLGAVHSLFLYSCNNVRDVSSLGAVHTLQLSNIPITDVSALGAVHTLFLMHCNGVSDISSLTGVTTLYLYQCLNIPVVQIAALRASGVDVRC